MNEKVYCLTMLIKEIKYNTKKEEEVMRKIQALLFMIILSFGFVVLGSNFSRRTVFYTAQFSYLRSW